MKSFCAILLVALGACEAKAVRTNAVVVLTVENKLEIHRAGARQQRWDLAAQGTTLDPGDHGRTGDKSRALLQVYDLSHFRVRPNSLFEIQPPPTEGQKSTLNLRQGALYFFSREKPNEINIRTPSASAAIRGTEFVLRYADDGRTVLTLLDGEVELSNDQGTVLLRSSEEGVAEPGKQPTKTAVIEAKNVIQWCLYYPGVLDLDELELSAAVQQELMESLTAYRQGDLLQTLATYPQGRKAAVVSEAVYFAGLLLAVGQVEEAEKELNQIPEGPSRAGRLAGALRRLIAAVTGNHKGRPRNELTLASEWLAESYWRQSRGELEEALEAARKAKEISPRFGFAWARVAELEFSFGRVGRANAELEKALELTPRNAEAIALKGFLFAARNQPSAAIGAFDEAIKIDGALGNAWLGRGLCKIRRGEREAGRADIQAAATLEPNRSFLRSYLGKAWSETDQFALAMKELDLAKKLDPGDPTPWLYSALLNRDGNRINVAIEELEESVLLNTNRQVYRSRFLLDEDRAVRSAGLATIYQKAGMADVSFREAARAVSYDYGNYSAHLFLANSLDALRDPTRFNLRYETEWFNELLLANLLAPVGSGALSQNISQQEYSRLFEANRLGLITDTTWRSDGQWRELASQFGTLNNTSYSLDLDYQHNDGIRANNELSRIEWYTTLKQQITPQDTILVLTKYQDYHSGDNFQYYSPENLRKDFKFEETQSPLVLGGYHHQWGPGMHTLLLGGRLVNDQRFEDKAVHQTVLATNAAGVVTSVNTLGTDPDGNDIGGMDVKLRGQFEIYTAELNQIFQGEKHLDVFGGRFQLGQFQTSDRMDLNIPPSFSFYPLYTNIFSSPAAAAGLEEDFERAAVYAYHTWQALQSLSLTAGVSYDRVRYPVNFRAPPIMPGDTTREQWSPKAALVWTPSAGVAFRAAYSQFLGGVSYDESIRLEPTHLAGFGQAFRSVISESVVGSVVAPSYEMFGAALDLKFKTRSYVGLEGQVLNSEVRREIGVFAYNEANLLNYPPPTVGASSTPEHLDYQEQSLRLGFDQILSSEWSVGAQYRFTRSELEKSFPAVPTSVAPSARSFERADLHQLRLYTVYNLPCGFFARVEADWYGQHNSGYDPQLLGDEFIQFNCSLGYRFPRQFGEMSVSVLNLTDTDYHLNPLSPYSELPRERVVALRLRLSF